MLLCAVANPVIVSMPNPHIRLLKFIILFKNCFKPFPYNKSICKDDTFYVLLKRKCLSFSLKNPKRAVFSSSRPAWGVLLCLIGDKSSAKNRKKHRKVELLCGRNEN
jgi:hypothetical protein